VESGDSITARTDRNDDLEQPSHRRAGQDVPHQAEGRNGRFMAEPPVRRILARISEEVGAAQFERYFDGQTRLSIEGDHLEVTVPTGFLAQLLDRRFGEQLKKACTENHLPANLSFRVDRDAFGLDREPASPRATPIPITVTPITVTSPAPSRAQQAKPAIQGSRFRFDSFVVGKSNRLAHAAITGLLEENAPTVAFIHSVCGMGKSHLLYSLVHAYSTLHPRATVRYTTAEAFTNEFIAAVRANKVDAFRKNHRRLDLLCIDDVHFLSNKDATQTELLHTLETADLAGARVAFASDESPRDIAKLQERLVSRFMGGVVAKIDAPDPELRERLVRHLAVRRGLRLEEAAISLVAERSARATGSLGGFGGSVRELEGLLTQIEAVHRLLPECAAHDGGIGANLVRKAFGLQESGLPPATRGARRPIAIEFIIEEVCRTLSVEFSELLGKGRHKRVVLARSLIVSLARRLTTMSFPEIAKAMGRPNHSTVITAQKRVDRDIAKPEQPPLGPELSPNFPSVSISMLSQQLHASISRATGG
jgi:chromosomal replication initiator protein